MDEAISSFENSILLDKKFIQGYNNLGNVYVKSGKFKKAIEMYNKVLSINPDYPAGYNNLASAQTIWENLKIRLKIMKTHLNMIQIMFLQKIILFKY